MKEEIVPAEADARLFKLAPYVVTMGFVAAFVVHPVRQRADRRRSQRRHPLHHRGHVAGRGRHPDGRLGVEQQVVADRRHPLGGADRQLRDPRRAVDLPDRADHRHAQHAGHHPAAGLGAVGLVPLLQPVHLRRLLDPVHRACSPRATARRSTCPRPSRSWSPASSPSTPAPATCSSSWSSGATCTSSAPSW